MRAPIWATLRRHHAMGVLSQHRTIRSVWLGAAAANAEEEARGRPAPAPPVALRSSARVPGVVARVAAPASTWPNVQAAVPGSGVAPRQTWREKIPRTTRLEQAISHGAVVLGHEPLRVVSSNKPERGRPPSGSMRAMHRMIEHLEARKAVLTKVFRDYDTDSSGSIDRDELSAGLRGLGLRLSQDEVDGVMAYLDTDGGGDIDLREFLHHFKLLRAERGFAARLSHPVRKQTQEATNSAKPRPSSVSRKAMARMIDHLTERKAVLTKMFREFDTDGSGTIDIEELDNALIRLGLRLSGQELQGVMDYLDTDGGGDIDLEEFVEHFRIERAKRFEGHIPELKEAKIQLLMHLRHGTQVVTNTDGKRSCSPTARSHDQLYCVLTAIERLQSLENLTPSSTTEIRSYIQALLQRGICDTTVGELKVLQHMHRMHAPQIDQGPCVPNGMSGKGPRFGECFTHRRLVRLPLFSTLFVATRAASINTCALACTSACDAKPATLVPLWPMSMQNTAEFREKKLLNYKAAIPSHRVVPNPRRPTPLDSNNADCTQLRTMGVPKHRSFGPPVARKAVFPPPKPLRLDALRSVARMNNCPAECYQPSHIVQVRTPRVLPGRAHNLKPASTRTPKQKITARPPEMPKTARPAVGMAADKFKIPSPPASKPASPIVGWLSSRLADELADRERARMQAVINSEVGLV